MKIYLASRWAQRLSLNPIRTHIQNIGHIVTSRWLDEPTDKYGTGLYSPEKAATQDLEDIDAADTLILWHEIELPIKALYGGMFVELGYALAKWKTVWVVDTTPSHSVFLALPRVQHFKDWPEVFQQLERLAQVEQVLELVEPHTTEHTTA